MFEKKKILCIFQYDMLILVPEISFYLTVI